MRSVTAPDGRPIAIYNSNDPAAVIPPTLINSYSALTIPAYFRAMRFISENMASLSRAVHKDGARVDVAHPLDVILRDKPNAYQNSTAFWRAMFFHAAHLGNGYARIDRGGADNNTDMRPMAIHNLDAGDVLPFRVDDGSGSGLQQYYYLRSTKTILHGDSVIHFAGLSFDGMCGVDPIHLHSDAFQRAKTLDKYQTRYLMKGTVLRGAIQIPGDMTKEQLQEMRQELRSKFRGSDAEDDILILWSGAKLENASMTPQESQLIEQCAYSTKQIAQITGVPPSLLFELGEQKYNASPELQGIDVVRYCLRPWIELAEDELKCKLLTPSERKQGYTIRLNADDLLRGDSKTVTATLTAQTNAGLRTANEARKVLDLPPDPDPKSDALRLLGDTNPKGLTEEEKPAPG